MVAFLDAFKPANIMQRLRDFAKFRTTIAVVLLLISIAAVCTTMYILGTQHRRNHLEFPPMGNNSLPKFNMFEERLIIVNNAPNGSKGPNGDQAAANIGAPEAEAMHQLTFFMAIYVLVYCYFVLWHDTDSFFECFDHILKIIYDDYPQM